MASFGEAQFRIAFRTEVPSFHHLSTALMIASACSSGITICHQCRRRQTHPFGSGCLQSQSFLTAIRTFEHRRHCGAFLAPAKYPKPRLSNKRIIALAPTIMGQGWIAKRLHIPTAANIISVDPAIEEQLKQQGQSHRKAEWYMLS
jgi:hypothetical protein